MKGVSLFVIVVTWASVGLGIKIKIWAQALTWALRLPGRNDFFSDAIPWQHYFIHHNMFLSSPDIGLLKIM